MSLPIIFSRGSLSSQFKGLQSVHYVGDVSRDPNGVDAREFHGEVLMEYRVNFRLVPIYLITRFFKVSVGCGIPTVSSRYNIILFRGTAFVFFVYR